MRQELLLDQRCDAHLLLEALAGLDLAGPLLDELGDPDGGRGLGGKAGEQPPVVGRVLLLGEPGAEVERPDQLALADQGHDQGDARVAQVAHGRRIELEAGELDRSGGGLEVGQERVVGGDVHLGARFQRRFGGDGASIDGPWRGNRRARAGAVVGAMRSMPWPDFYSLHRPRIVTNRR